MLMNRIASDKLISNNIYVDSIKNKDGIKFLNKNESIKKYFKGETILPYDWAPDYENTFSLFNSTGYTAQCSGWMSIDRAEANPTSIFINGNIVNTFSNNGSLQLFVSRGDIVTASSPFDFTFSPSISDSKISFEFNITPYDIWSAIPVKNDDGLTLLKNLHIPNAGAWSVKVREANNLIITKIVDNKAYNEDVFVCNIQFEKIKFALNLFSDCETLTSFNSELSSLEDAPGMFFNCNLDSQSVEKILSSIPTYTEGYHTLTLTIQESAKEKFQEITGQTIELGNFYDISYKGWRINIFIKDNRLTQTPYDIYKNVVILKDDGYISIKNLYIPNASAWNEEIYKQYKLNITSVNSDKAYNGDAFICNIQSKYIENGDNLFLNNKKLVSFEGNLNALSSANYMFKNCYALTSFENDLSNLISAKDMFLNCENLSIFNGDISKLSDGTNMFIGCTLNSTSIEHILNSIPTYTEGTHNLGLTLKTIEEAAVFNQITGANVEIGNIYNVSYKGWTITTYILKDDREIPTKYDIWENVISVNKETGTVEFVDLYIPDASAWKTEIYDNFKLRISKVEDNRAYNGSNFVCNILSEKIVNGDNLFNGVSSLTSFTDDLSSLSSGVNMFNECSLDSISVETILSTIPTYTDGEHILTMRIDKDAAEKFKEITGATNISEELLSISFKGWTIQVNKVSILATEYDIWEGTPYIPDASNWRADVYNKNNIRITDVKDNKMFNGDEIVANIQCENIETDATINLENQMYIPSLFSNTHLKSFEGDLSSLKIPFATFASTNITNFDSDLSNVTFAPFGLFGDCFDLTEFNSDLPNLVMSEMGNQSLMIIMLNIPIPFPKPISFINTGLTSFDGDLSSLVCSNMFLYCDKLENFSSDISSLGDFSKLYEHPEIIDWLKTMGILSSDYVLPTIDLWGENELNLFATNGMFMGCNLNSASVEHILNSLTSYNDGLPRMLAMTINSSAVPTFTQITGATFGENSCQVTFKGWDIYCEIKEEFVPTTSDVLEGSPNCDEVAILLENQDYTALQNTLSYALSQADSSIKFKLNDNKLYVNAGGEDMFAFNVQCDKLVSSLGAICFFDEIIMSDFPKLKYNMNIFGGNSGGLSSFNSDLRSLTLDQGGFSGTPLYQFYTSLHSLVYSMSTFADCGNLSEFYSDLRSLCCGEAMFAGCSNLTSFNAGLFSLGDVEKFVDVMYDFYLLSIPEGEEPPTKEDMMQDLGDIAFGGDMFTGCNLDAPSVENILTTIPEWNDEIYRELGMTIQSGEAAEKFGEITGIIPASTEVVEVPFKGWNIKVNLFSV